MKTSFLLRTIVAASALFLSVGSISRLAAQDAETVTTTGKVYTDGPITRTYTGTATQTTAAGVTTTGTFSLLYHRDAVVQASITFNGVVTYYGGNLVASTGFYPTPIDLTHPYKQVKNTGLLINAGSPPPSPNGISLPVVVILSQMPAFVDKTVAYGGQQNADGSVLTFRATRDAK